MAFLGGRKNGAPHPELIAIALSGELQNFAVGVLQSPQKLRRGQKQTFDGLIVLLRLGLTLEILLIPALPVRLFTVVQELSGEADDRLGLAVLFGKVCVRIDSLIL